MRLDPSAIATIRATVRDMLGAQAEVRLFGSRLDDTARGGDIDLHVSTPTPLDNPVWSAALLAARLQRRLGGRSVDVRLLAPGVRRQPIDDIAQREGVLL